MGRPIGVVLDRVRRRIDALSHRAVVLISWERDAPSRFDPGSLAMSDFGSYRTNVSFFDSPQLPAAAFAGVRSRRMLAFALDFVLVSILAVVIGAVLFVATVGLSVFFFHVTLWPIVAFFYNGMSVSGTSMATPGMRLCDLQLRMTDGARPSFIAAGLHGVLLYVSWLFPPVFLWSLVSPDKRCLHDIFAGLIAVRRPD